MRESKVRATIEERTRRRIVTWVSLLLEWAENQHYGKALSNPLFESLKDTQIKWIVHETEPLKLEIKTKLKDLSMLCQSVDDSNTRVDSEVKNGIEAQKLFERIKKNISNDIELLRRKGFLENIRFSEGKGERTTKEEQKFYFILYSFRANDNLARLESILPPIRGQKKQFLRETEDDSIHKLKEKLFKVTQDSLGEIQLLGFSAPIRLEDIYVDDITSWDQLAFQREEALSNLEQNNSSSLLTLNRLPETLYPGRTSAWEKALSQKRLMFLGKPGIGKTTFLTYLAYQCAKGIFHNNKIPVFIRLLDFSVDIRESERTQTLFKHMKEFWIGSTCLEQTLEEHLIQGNVVLFLDGLDEVVDISKVIDKMGLLDLWCRM